MTSLNSWKEQGRISPASLESLRRFVDLILEWNARINLTGFKTREAIEENLISPSIAALACLPISGKRVLDFGSGAGIPGLAWALCEPSSQITSVEIRQKKVAFQKEVVRATGASCEIVCGHFPEAIRGRRFDVIATRAVRFSPRLWSDAQAHLAPGGVCARFAASPAQEPGWEAKALEDGSTLLLAKSTP